MIRARFHTNGDDYRAVNWPVKHPYWCSGYAIDKSYSVVVAYADDLVEILRNWPEASHIEFEEVDKYVFTERFPKPSWFEKKPTADGTGGEDLSAKLKQLQEVQSRIRDYCKATLNCPVTQPGQQFCASEVLKILNGTT